MRTARPRTVRGHCDGSGEVRRTGTFLSIETVLETPTDAPAEELIEEVDLTGRAWHEIILEALREIWDGFLHSLPLLAIGLFILLAGLGVAWIVVRVVRRWMRRSDAEASAEELTIQLVRGLVILLFLLFALSIVGVNVGAALAGLGIAGLAVAFAMQNILENFISGVLLLIRKPFRIGDQIRTNDYEGTVEDLDLRVTRLRVYAGEIVLIPNADVFRNPIVNLTRRGKRRTSVFVGVDYRDDQDRAREVILAAVRDVTGVLSTPEPEVLLTELGESSVDFEVRYWTLPDIRSVRHTQDRVLSAVKSAVEGAGMSIPWPIRSVVFDGPLDVDEPRAGRAP